MSERDSVSLRFRSPEGNRYELFEEFAAGGVATLHLARFHPPDGEPRVVAVKRLHEHHAKDPGLRAALLDEARLIAQVKHQNVVTVLDVCDDADDLFIAMEYVHGVSLARLEKLTAPKPIDPAMAATILSDALEGLHAAHEACAPDGRRLELVHRDVSPQNIIVGEDGIARVIDFGLAYALGRAQSTQSGVVKGKPSYMSPEQVRGERVTRASDIFSAGVVLWGALTGKKLFDGDVIEATLSQLLTGPIRKPTDLVPEVPAALERTVMRALARPPASRFQTAHAMAHALGSACPRVAAAEIGDWVKRVAAEDLADMKERLAEIEDGSPPMMRSQSATRGRVESPQRPDTPDGVPTGRWKPPRWLPTAALVLAAGAIGWCAATVSGTRKTAEAERPAATTTAEADDDPGASIDDPTFEPTSADAHASAAAAKPPRRRTPRSGPAGSAHKKRDCLDPYDPRCK